MREITIGSRVTFGYGDPNRDPIGRVTFMDNGPQGVICGVQWATFENTCFQSDLRAVVEQQS